MPSGLFFIELAKLAELETGKPFDGMAAGEFTDMWGSEFELEAEDFPEFVSNTMTNIEATRTDSGELVGLPIDTDHSHGGAVGWIVKVELSGSDIIKFTPVWTDEGKELIEGGTFRFFSPTFHLKQKVIVGGALTNWPATRDEGQKILLKPVELSRHLHTMALGSKPGLMTELTETLKGIRDFMTRKGDEADPEEKPKKEGVTKMDVSKLDEKQLAELQAQVLTEMVGTPPTELAELITAKAKEMTEVMLAEEIEKVERKGKVTELCSKLVGGTDEKPQGLPVKRSDLEEFLLSLDTEQQDKAEAILNKVYDNGLVGFGELGHSKRQSGMTPLPKFYVDKINSGELELADLSNPVIATDLGDIADYDLSELKEKQEA